ncbi:hypothetical protein CRM22_005137 [Opisthorchis felineus]|uniref:Transcription initiation factor TFIID subunit 9 n=1 Tax=Opisthorchis felineus TaxID=147828 RepID=A0A4S2LYB0_OPIFE|nr:hypothetical protein CRM22_005137 [Opisthorchis felineus]
MGDIKPSAEPSELVPPSLGTIREIFDEFNVCDVSDEICTRVLDVLYRHTCDVVEESRAVANHTGHTTIEEGDMKLAIESISDGLLFAPPHKEQLLAYAEKNSNPLPTIRVHHGLRLPTERNNLTAPNYTLAKQEIDTETSQQVYHKPPSLYGELEFQNSTACFLLPLLRRTSQLFIFIYPFLFFCVESDA